MFLASKQLLVKAREKGYALPALNTSNLEVSQAIFAGHKALHAPVLIATAQAAIRYAALPNLYAIIRSLASETKLPTCLHLDHGTDLQLIKRCIALGYRSVMIDASKSSFSRNVAITRKVVRFAHRKRVSVEAELGALGRLGIAKLTDAKQAKLFVEKTKCDALAVAIGTSHGAHKFKGKPKIDLQRLKEISDLVSVPLVLHGASSVDSSIVKKANRYGAKIKGAQGVPERAIKRAVKLGVAKVNIDTDLRLAFTAAMRESLKKNPSEYDPRNALAAGRSAVEKTVKEKIKLLGSARKI